MARADSSRIARTAGAVQRVNRRPGLVRAVHTARELLPGDENFGDELSIADDRPTAVIARFLAELPVRVAGADGEQVGSEIPSVSREVALTGLQLWQVVSQRVGRGSGTVRATVLFTDLVGFSSWVLGAGDEAALELLRAVAGVVEPTIGAHRGRVVKRLGDGHMAMFPVPLAGVRAALEIQEGIEGIEVAGYRPRLRAGLHHGQPRRLGSDLLGADVNIAARVSEAARPGEVLVSGPLLEAIAEPDRAELAVKRRRGFRAKGAPTGLEVYTVGRAV